MPLCWAEKIGYEELAKKISLANVLHSENPLKVVEDLIDAYHLEPDSFDISEVDKSLVDQIPSATQMGKVYQRLILSNLKGNEDYVQGLLRIYGDPICDNIDNYNSSAYYEPSYVITRAYYEGQF